MKIGLDKVQRYLETKGLGWLLPTLRKYKKPLLILGIIAAGGLAATTMGGQEPWEISQMSQEEWNSINPETQGLIMQGHEAVERVTELTNSLNQDIDKALEREGL